MKKEKIYFCEQKKKNTTIKLIWIIVGIRGEGEKKENTFRYWNGKGESMRKKWKKLYKKIVRIHENFLFLSAYSLSHSCTFWHLFFLALSAKPLSPVFILLCWWNRQGMKRSLHKSTSARMKNNVYFSKVIRGISSIYTVYVPLPLLLYTTPSKHFYPLTTQPFLRSRKEKQFGASIPSFVNYDCLFFVLFFFYPFPKRKRPTLFRFFFYYNIFPFIIYSFFSSFSILHLHFSSLWSVYLHLKYCK